MKLPYDIRHVHMHISSFSGAKTYTITGDRWTLKMKITLSEPEWKALCEARGHTVSVGEELIVWIPGELPEDEELADEEAEG